MPTYLHLPKPWQTKLFSTCGGKRQQVPGEYSGACWLARSPRYKEKP